MIVRSSAALNEMQIYSIEPNGKTNAPEGYNDDLVMAWAIGVYVCRMHQVYEDVW